MKNIKIKVYMYNTNVQHQQPRNINHIGIRYLSIIYYKMINVPRVFVVMIFFSGSHDFV